MSNATIGFFNIEVTGDVNKASASVVVETTHLVGVG